MLSSRGGRRTQRALSLALLVVAVGCGQVEQDDSSEAGQVSLLISEVADAATKEQSLQALFAATAKPDKKQRQQYARFSYRPLETPVLAGDRATIKVRVRHARNDAEAGEMEWTAIKEGDAWKLEQAPLPSAKGGA